jgi:hypothetical protein
MTYREKCDARIEKIQQRQDAGPISKRFPEVSSIVVDMQHHRKGISDILIWRTLNFSSGSNAYFHVECLNSDCKDCAQGFDLDQVVGAMIRSHASSTEGQLDCKGIGLTSNRVNIDYKVTIRYTDN